MIYSNGQLVDVEFFNNNEARIEACQRALHTTMGQGVTLRLAYRNDGDLMHLLFVRRHLNTLNPAYVDLELDYMPYSRMDRQTSDIFTLKYVADFLNGLEFRRITVHEPHSDVTPALLHNCVATYPSATWLLDAAMADMGFTSRDVVFFPDAGALKRYRAVAEKYQYLVGSKSRPDGPGSVTDYKIVTDDKVFDPATKVLIVDDLCAKGGTFLAAATALHAVGLRAIWLVVTHLEEAYWRGDLHRLVGAGDDALLRGIYTTNSLQSHTSQGATSQRDNTVAFFDLITHHQLSRINYLGDIT